MEYLTYLFLCGMADVLHGKLMNDGLEIGYLDVSDGLILDGRTMGICDVIILGSNRSKSLAVFPHFEMIDSINRQLGCTENRRVFVVIDEERQCFLVRSKESEVFLMTFDSFSDSPRPPPVAGQMSDGAVTIWKSHVDHAFREGKMTNEEIYDKLVQLENKIQELIRAVTIAQQSAKSAHHRIDDLKRSICWTLGVSVTVVGIFASILTSFLKWL